MATITHLVSTASTTNNSGTNYPSGLFTPALNDLLVVMVTTSGNANAGSITNSVGTTFSLVTSTTKATGDNIHMFVANSLVSSATSQSCTFVQSGNISGAIISVVGISGISRTGTNAIKQFAVTTNAAAGTPSVTFSSSLSSSNPVIAFVGNGTNGGAITQPSGWTEYSDISYNTPATGQETAGINSGASGTTITWGSASASGYGIIAAEIDISLVLTQSISYSDPDSVYAIQQINQLLSQSNSVASNSTVYTVQSVKYSDQFLNQDLIFNDPDNVYIVQSVNHILNQIVSYTDPDNVYNIQQINQLLSQNLTYSDPDSAYNVQSVNHILNQIVSYSDPDNVYNIERTDQKLNQSVSYSDPDNVYNIERTDQKLSQSVSYSDPDSAYNVQSVNHILNQSNSVINSVTVYEPTLFEPIIKVTWLEFDVLGTSAQTLSPELFVNTNIFYTHTVNYIITEAPCINDNIVYNVQRIDQKLSQSVSYSDPDNVYNIDNVIRGTVLLPQTVIYSDPDNVYNIQNVIRGTVTLSQSVSYTDPDNVYNIQNVIRGTVLLPQTVIYSDPDNVYNIQNVIRGTVTLSQSVSYSDPDNVYNIDNVIRGTVLLPQTVIYSDPDNVYIIDNVLRGTVTVSQSSTYTDPDNVYNIQNVLSGAVTLTQTSSLINEQIWYQQIVSFGGSFIQPNLYSNNNVVYNIDNVLRGAISITQSVSYSDPDNVYNVQSVNHILNQTVSYSDPDSVYNVQRIDQKLTQSVSYSDSDNVYNVDNVIRGTVLLPQTVIYSDSDNVYEPSIITGGVSLYADLFNNANIFYASTIVNGGVSIYPSLYINDSIFYSPSIGLSATAYGTIINTNIYSVIGTVNTSSIASGNFANTSSNVIFSRTDRDVYGDIKSTSLKPLFGYAKTSSKKDTKYRKIFYDKHIPNFLQKTGYKFEIDKLNNVTYMIQNVNLPDIGQHIATVNTPILDYDLPGNKMYFGEFSFSFMVNEQMENYKELLKWIGMITDIDILNNASQKILSEQLKYLFIEQYKDIMSDGILHILDNENNTNKQIIFHDMFPTQISDIDFSTTVDDINYVSCNVTMKYSHYKFL